MKRVIIEKLVEIYEKDGVFNEQINFQDGLTVMLFVGVNGVGKTTSIGKLAYKYKNEGKKVMLVAADTFRAGAVAQLAEWGRRVDVPVVTGPEKADPASVVFDGMERAVAENVDVLLIDTAGRLQNKDNLMAELEKIGRIIKRVVPDAPHETLLALDASTGQNALSQAKEFSKITPLTGLILTKIDGTAKGGVVLAIVQLIIWVKDLKMHSHLHGKLAKITSPMILVTPVLIGLLVPTVTLDSTTVSAKGYHFPLAAGSTGTVSEDGTRVQYLKPDTSLYFTSTAYDKEMRKEMKKYKGSGDLTITTDNYMEIMELIYLYPDEFSGRNITYTGFVYNEPGHDGYQFLFRFGIIHCIADSGVYGLLTTGNATSYPPRT